MMPYVYRYNKGHSVDYPVCESVTSMFSFTSAKQKLILLYCPFLLGQHCKEVSPFSSFFPILSGMKSNKEGGKCFI